jgi:hypothetical protein
VLAYGTNGGFTLSIDKMATRDRIWYVKRLNKQIVKENKELEKAKTKR